MNMRRGFSLVELSIVLVILGLLVGGILAGQSLIRASELRAAISERDRYQTAFFGFRDKYMAWPGDMANAVKFWGAADNGSTADGTNASCLGLTTASTDMKTCNGNGDGLINAGTVEMWRFWQQLANAGLIEGQYSGITDASNHAIPGTNSPRSKVSGAGWAMQGNIWTSDTCDFAQSGNRLIVGAETAGNIPITPVFKPEEAWNIDTKTDDGRPGLGKTLVWGPLCNAGCADSATAATAVYQLSSATKACAMIFQNPR